MPVLSFQAFAEVDANRDGLVSAAEFHTALHRLRVELPASVVDKCIEEVQVMENPGYVEYAGLAQCISKYKCWILSVKQIMDAIKHERRLFNKSLKDLKSTFAAMDSNKDGELDAQEFQMGLKQLDVGLSSLQVEEMMSAFDLDGNGRLDLAEFIDAVHAYQASVA